MILDQLVGRGSGEISQGGEGGGNKFESLVPLVASGVFDDKKRYAWSVVVLPLIPINHSATILFRFTEEIFV